MDLQLVGTAGSRNRAWDAHGCGAACGVHTESERRIIRGKDGEVPKVKTECRWVRINACPSHCRSTSCDRIGHCIELDSLNEGKHCKRRSQSDSEGRHRGTQSLIPRIVGLIWGIGRQEDLHDEAYASERERLRRRLAIHIVVKSTGDAEPWFGPGKRPKARVMSAAQKSGQSDNWTSQKW